LGLSICWQIAQGLGGTIGFESQKGKGTTFSFKFKATSENNLKSPQLLSGVKNRLKALVSQTRVV